MQRGLVVGALLLVFGMAGSALADETHVATAVVLAADTRAVTVQFDDGSRRILLIAGTTEAYDEYGAVLPGVGLRAGDVVREQCTRLHDGRYLVKWIALVRPAGTTQLRQNSDGSS